MAELDEISAAIGSLRTQAAETTRKQEATFRKLDKISEQVSELTGQIRLVVEQVSEIKKELDEEIRPPVQDYKSLKAKGLGVLAFVAILASGTGAGIIKVSSFLGSSSP